MTFPWNAFPEGFGMFDLVVAILLAAGCVLSLPVYWWLFGTPFVRLWRCWRPRRDQADKHGSVHQPEAAPAGPDHPADKALASKLSSQTSARHFAT